MLVDMYNNFIAHFGHRINLLKLAQFAVLASQQLDDPAESGMPPANPTVSDDFLWQVSAQSTDQCTKRKASRVVQSTASGYLGQDQHSKHEKPHLQDLSERTATGPAQAQLSSLTR